jgi:hypothetical protein
MTTRAHHFARVRITGQNPSCKGVVLVWCGFPRNAATLSNEKDRSERECLERRNALTGHNSPGRDTNTHDAHAVTSENKIITDSDIPACPQYWGHNSLTRAYSVNGDAP